MIEYLQEGDIIEITNLPNPINHPNTKSCYIGMIGKAKEMSEGWYLDTGKSILILGDRFSYKFIHNYKLHSL